MDMSRIDWNLLAKQKQWLLGHAQTSPEAAGLVELLDWLQDTAVDKFGLPEGTVFPGIDRDAEEEAGPGKSFKAEEAKRRRGGERER